jgi:hypothetical protein
VRRSYLGRLAVPAREGQEARGHSRGTLGFLGRLGFRERYHRETRRLPRRFRARIYHELLELREEERAMQNLLRLPVRPRLSVVDEENIALLRPIDRVGLGLDQALADAREAHASRSESDD